MFRCYCWFVQKSQRPTTYLRCIKTHRKSWRSNYLSPQPAEFTPNSWTSNSFTEPSSRRGLRLHRPNRCPGLNQGMPDRVARIEVRGKFFHHNDSSSQGLTELGPPDTSTTLGQVQTVGSNASTMKRLTPAYPPPSKHGRMEAFWEFFQ